MSSVYQHTIAEFENKLSEYTGAPYAIAVDSCTNALLLCCRYFEVRKLPEIEIPSRTYPSVPCCIIHAGGRVKFKNSDWSGIYNLSPTSIWDCAKRFTKNMYVSGTTQCISFHGKKILNIGRGGAILTDNGSLYIWAKQARFDGRHEVPLNIDDISIIGHNCYMLPEQAARGMMLMDYLNIENKDLPDTYPDLSKMSVNYESFNRIQNEALHAAQRSK